MDLRKLKTLIDLVETSSITELEVTEGEEKVRIVKSSAAYAAPAHTLVAAPVPMQTMAPAAAVIITPPAPPAPPGHSVKSPMVGTFYRSASPGSKVFVNVGTEVKEGDVLCIIEAMKLLNELPAEHAGVVRQILVENGQPVEYGQVLFIIE